MDPKQRYKGTALYYIPERVIVRMFTLRKWYRPRPRSIIIFEGWTFLLLPSGMYYLFYYAETTIRQDTLRERCWWGRCGFLGETKSCAKTAQIWFQNDYSLLMVSFTNSRVIGILMRRNTCFSVAIVIERLYAHQCCAFESKLSQCDSKNFYPPAMEVLRGTFMWGIINYDNS